MFYREKVLRMIVKSLRSVQPYDLTLRTERVTMPRYVFDKLFGTLQDYKPRRKIYGADKERQKKITSINEFMSVFGGDLPKRVFNTKPLMKISQLKVPLILFYSDKSVSGCSAIMQFNITDKNGRPRNEFRSKK